MSQSALPTIRGALHRAAIRLAESGSATPSLDARILAGQALRCDAAGLICKGTETISNEALAALDAMIDRRAAHEPVARILGRREFYGRTLSVTPAVLDPRPETELLVDIAVTALTDELGTPVPRILDLGTGSGAILVSLLAECPHATGIGVDVDEDAVRVASRNAHALGVADRAIFVAADWDSSLGGIFDLVVSNPPYIARREMADLGPDVAGHDPARALDGGVDGLESHRAVIASATRRLKPGTGTLIVEIGSTQAQSVVDLMVGAGLACDPAQDIRQDLAGHDRIVRGRLQKAGKP